MAGDSSQRRSARVVARRRQRAATSGGASPTATLIPAIAKATDQAVQSLLKVAALTSGSPFEKVDPKNLKMTGGRVHKEGDPAESGTPFPDLLKLRKLS